jgi:hypothetical protein
VVTKTRGPLMEDYKRALRAAKWAGVKAVRIEMNGTAIVMIMDETYLDKLAIGQPPAPNSNLTEEERKEDFKLKW